MRTTATLFAAAAAVASVSGQTLQNYTSSLDMTIDPNTVPVQQRATWCQGQTNTCNLLCDLDTQENSCVQTTLEYECTCSSNSSAPGLQYYLQTMPTFICEQLYSQCINENAGDASGQEACTNQIDALCGEAEPPTPSDDEESETSTSASPTTTSAPSTTGTEDPSPTEESDTTESDNFAAPTMAPVKGFAAFAAMGLAAALL
ncbi:hypothetical protein S40288_08140 [Stachybotrys chartarum IBT 40288]|nr:hypothetical protein S40288_08140 [Stachybotrys chartarum IBT 40288]